MKNLVFLSILLCFLPLLIHGCDWAEEMIFFSSPKWWIERGIGYYNNGDMVKAEEAFEYANYIDPENDEIYRWLAYVNRELGDDYDYRKYAFEAVRLNPNNARNYDQLGNFFADSDNYEKAI